MCGGLLAGACLAALLGVAALAPAAAGGVKLGVNPVKLDLVLDPGGERVAAVDVHNSGDEPMRVTTGVSTWTTTRDGAMDLSPAAPVARAASSWVAPEMSEFTVTPHSSVTVRITASLPDTARGSYWTIVFFEAEALDRPGGLAVGARGRIGTTIYLTARGTEMRDEALTGMDIVPAGDPLCLALSFTLANRGNVHRYARGWIQVLEPDGAPLVEDTIPLRVLLPGHESVYPRMWRPPHPGSFRFVVTLDLGLETLVQGVKEFTVEDDGPLMRLAARDEDAGAGAAGTFRR